MPKVIQPFRTHLFTSETRDIKSLQAEFRVLIDFIVVKEQEVLASSFDAAVDAACADAKLLKGSVNRAGKKIGLGPVFSEEEKQKHRHLHNLSEMISANLMSLVGSYVQRRKLFNLIAESSLEDVRTIASIYREQHGQTVSSDQISKVLNALRNTGSVDSLPSPPRKLPLWAADMYHAKLTVSEKTRQLNLTVKLNSGRHTLTFSIPKHIDVATAQKFSRPTVMLDRKGRIVFDFTAITSVEKPSLPSSWLGVDLGRIKTFTASVVGDGFHSQEISDTRQIRMFNSKIDRLHGLVRANSRKRLLNKGRHEMAHALQDQEIRRLRHKITRLKNERAHAVANILVRIARASDAGIALENLGWVTGSRWEQSLVQKTIQDEAVKSSVAVKKVSARHTSTTCSRCGGADTRFRGRTLMCRSCDSCADRDLNASQNIALRAMRKKTLPKKKQSLSVGRNAARRTRDNIPGQLAISSCADSTASNLQLLQAIQELQEVRGVCPTDSRDKPA